jgi:Ion channel
MRILVGILSVVLIVIILQDAFETIVLPRRPSRRLRLTRLFYTLMWHVWSGVGRKIRTLDVRDNYLGYFGPLSLLLLLIVWAVVLIFGFASLQWAFGAALHTPEGAPTFFTVFYMSGTTFFTLGLGDVTPVTTASRIITVIECGIGFGFLALVIGYLPVIYQSFSRREVNISLLDAHAGSPPSAAELLHRHGVGHDMDALVNILRDGERWAADMMESQLSYPVLMYYRSQHDRQSWVAALTTFLDVCALVIVGVDGIPAKPAWFTFAIARHASVDLSQIFGSRVKPFNCKIDRLPPEEFKRLCEYLISSGIQIKSDEQAYRKLKELRKLYEPYVNALSEYLLMSLPNWMNATETIDDWRTSAWEHAERAPVA